MTLYAPIRLPEVTAEEVAENLRAARIHHCTVDQIMAAPDSLRGISAEKYAGRNPMAHCERRIDQSGYAGFGQLLDNLSSARAAKFKAGGWLVIARRRRALLQPRKSVIYALNMAQHWRKEAARRAGLGL